MLERIFIKKELLRQDIIKGHYVVKHNVINKLNNIIG